MIGEKVLGSQGIVVNCILFDIFPWQSMEPSRFQPSSDRFRVLKRDLEKTLVQAKTSSPKGLPREGVEILSCTLHPGRKRVPRQFSWAIRIHQSSPGPGRCWKIHINSCGSCRRTLQLFPATPSSPLTPSPQLHRQSNTISTGLLATSQQAPWTQHRGVVDGRRRAPCPAISSSAKRSFKYLSRGEHSGSLRTLVMRLSGIGGIVDLILPLEVTWLRGQPPVCSGFHGFQGAILHFRLSSRECKTSGPNKTIT